MYDNLFYIYIFIMAILTYKDIRYMSVDDTDILLGTVIACSYHIIVQSMGIFIIGGLSGMIVPIFIKKIGDYIFRTESLGGGDVTLSILIGFFWGWKIMLLTWYFSILFLTIYSFYMLLKRKNIKRQIVPFVPFMFIGSLTAIWFSVSKYGEVLVIWKF